MTKTPHETPEALLDRGIALGEKGDLDQAADLMMKAAKGQDYDFLLKAGAALEGIKRFGKAQELYAWAMKLEPENFLTYFRLGALFAELEKVPLAIRNLERAVELNPGNGDLHYNLALTYQSAGEIDKAIASLGLAFRLSAETQTKYRSFGISLEPAPDTEDWVLPVPAVYLITADRRVAFLHYDPDYRRRLDPVTLVGTVGWLAESRVATEILHASHP